MEKYKNTNGNSGVAAYEIGPDYILVQFFNTPGTYTYSYRRAGRVHVENMKQLARNGSGLGTYINKNTKYLYD